MTFVLFVYHLSLLPLYALKDQLDGKLKNFPGLFLEKDYKEPNSLEFSHKKCLKMLRVEEITHFFKHFDFPVAFFPLQNAPHLPLVVF